MSESSPQDTPRQAGVVNTEVDRLDLCALSVRTSPPGSAISTIVMYVAYPQGAPWGVQRAVPSVNAALLVSHPLVGAVHGRVRFRAKYMIVYNRNNPFIRNHGEVHEERVGGAHSGHRFYARFCS
jgi:hypothetical protein